MVRATLISSGNNPDLDARKLIQSANHNSGILRRKDKNEGKRKFRIYI
jgi:hypothetical protein